MKEHTNNANFLWSRHDATNGPAGSSANGRSEGAQVGKYASDPDVGGSAWSVAMSLMQ